MGRDANGRLWVPIRWVLIIGAVPLVLGFAMIIVEGRSPLAPSCEPPLALAGENVHFEGVDRGFPPGTEICVFSQGGREVARVTNPSWDAYGVVILLSASWTLFLLVCCSISCRARLACLAGSAFTFVIALLVVWFSR